MPELPEVETVARGLAKHLVGRSIEQVCLVREDMVHGCAVPLCVALPNQRIATVARKGKQVHLEFDPLRKCDANPWSLAIHLGMTGRLIVCDSSSELEPHTHLRVTFRNWRQELRFIDPRRFGGIWLLSESDSQSWRGRRLPPIGLDPLRISLRDFRKLLERGRQIKALLLDQSCLGGMGNIYADESLHRAGIHPLTAADVLLPEQVRRLHRAIRTVLAAAIRAGGSSISDYRGADNQPGYFQVQHRVYDRAGKPCRNCGTSIEHLTAAGRSTFICPNCQPQW